MSKRRSRRRKSVHRVAGPLALAGVTAVSFGARPASGLPVDGSLPAPGGSVPVASTRAGGGSPVSSQPPDQHIYARPLAPGDAPVKGALPSGWVLKDTIVSNTDSTLAGTDTWGDWEPSLALNGANPKELIISAFSSVWSAGNAALFRSVDGGSTWSKVFSIPRPPGTPGNGCPCDQVFDFDRSQHLLGSILDEVSGGDVYTGSTNQASNPLAWLWRTSGGVAVKTDSPGGDDADQPWLRVGPNPANSAQDNAYVAYDDFTASQLKVGVSSNANPPNISTTRVIGPLTSFVNPGLRLGVNPANGTVYAVYQYATQKNADGSFHVEYVLNRSTDGGNTWSLNGSSSGVYFVQGNSDQVFPKFGGVNALLGGVDAVAVDKTSGDVYVVYGYKDTTTGNDRLAIARLVANGTGGLQLASNVFLTGQVTAALPSVAVRDDGTVGVLYDTYDGNNASGFPVFSAHLAQSKNHGTSFNDTNILSFASPATDDGDPRQRVLGDYQSLRSYKNNFYGTFVGNGASFGRPFSNGDAVFFKAPK
jgi:hypothetical protein